MVTDAAAMVVAEKAIHWPAQPSGPEPMRLPAVHRCAQLDQRPPSLLLSMLREWRERHCEVRMAGRTVVATAGWDESTHEPQREEQQLQRRHHHRAVAAEGVHNDASCKHRKASLLRRCGCGRRGACCNGRSISARAGLARHQNLARSATHLPRLMQQRVAHLPSVARSLGEMVLAGSERDEAEQAARRTPCSRPTATATARLVASLAACVARCSGCTLRVLRATGVVCVCMCMRLQRVLSLVGKPGQIG